MIKFNFSGCDSFVDRTAFKEYENRASESCRILLDGTGAGSEFTGWKSLPTEIAEEDFAKMEAVRDDWKAQGINLVVVIGIGGSYLGAKCALEALSHSFIPNPNAPRVVFAGNCLSEEYHAELLDLVQQSNTACVVISKSGTTTEPAVAFRLIKKHIEETYGKAAAKDRIVAITDARKGALKTLSVNEGYRSFVVPDNVGGRYSVLTAVGLLPIVLAGFDIRAMVSGAAKELNALLNGDDSAVRYAAMRNYLYSELGKKVEILVSFNPRMQYLGEWWKQLFGESEGKEGKGIFPASLTYTTDLHSMGQYIQEGERMLFETVLCIENSRREVRICADETDLDQLNYLAGKRVEHCNEMARLGTAKAHLDGGVPQMEVHISRIDEENLGALFFFFEFACGISAYTLGINPFNQPGVEAYKKNMFALLEKPGY